MKKVLLSLAITAGMAVMFFLTGCGEKDVPTPKDVCPNKEGVQTSLSECQDTPPPPPAPTGTVTADKTSIGWKETVTFSYSFTNTNQIIVNGTTILVGTSGTYTTGYLFKDSSFVFVATGSGGTKTQEISISVSPDSRIPFLTTGVFVRIEDIAKPVDSTNWVNFPTGCDTYVFYWDNLTSFPGNREVTTKGSCTSTPGVTTTYGWYFVGESGLYWHGVNHDKFVQLSSDVFKIHYYGTVIWAGIPQPGEVWETYQKK